MEYDHYFQVHYNVIGDYCYFIFISDLLRIILSGSPTLIIIYKVQVKSIVAVKASPRDVQAAGPPLALIEKFNMGIGKLSQLSPMRLSNFSICVSFFAPKALIKMIELPDPYASCSPTPGAASSRS